MNGPGKPRTSWYYAIATGLLILAAAFVAVEAFLYAPVWDEVGHIAAGYSHWRFGDFSYYRVNPPLVRLVAAIPLFLQPLRVDDAWFLSAPLGRPEFAAGVAMLSANKQNLRRLMTSSRLACVPFLLIGGLIMLSWSKRAFGRASGLAALTLWTTGPNILAHASLITPDLGAAALGLAAGYAFFYWLRQPTWKLALIAGCTLGTALLTKFTLLVFVPLWLALCAAARRPADVRLAAVPITSCVAMTLLMLVAAIAIINCGYAVDGSFTRLGEFEFASESLGAEQDPRVRGRETGNRFSGTVLGQLRMPVPREYILGVDFQKTDFEARLPSYLRGEWRRGGWYHYYVYALFVKEPLGNWVLVGLALYVSLFRKQYNAPWREELLLLAPAVTILVFVSSQTGFNHHVRYVLPALPFVYIWCSKVFKSYQLKHWGIAAIASGALIWSVVSSLSVFPHSLSYFNELAGGPKNGHWHLAHSNTDWGQDLYHLRDWYDRHPEARPFRVAYDNVLGTRVVGIDELAPPRGAARFVPAGSWWLQRPSFTLAHEDHAAAEAATGDSVTGPIPGWYAVSVNKLHSFSHEYDYFLAFDPVDWVGRTMPIYHISREDANRAQRILDLSALP